jgi:PKD domain-containing protein
MTDATLRTAALGATERTPCDWDFAVAGVDAQSGTNVAFVWDFGDGQSAGTLEPSAAHEYAADGDRRVTVTLVASGRSDETAVLDISVADCTRAAAIQSGQALLPAAAVRSPSAPAPADLLIVSVILPLLGAGLVIAGVGAAASQLWVSGGLTCLVGLFLFLTWSSSSGPVTPQLLMQTMHCLLFWIVALVGPVVVTVSGFFWGVDTLLAATAGWAICGAVLGGLGRVMARVGCVRTC